MEHDSDAPRVREVKDRALWPSPVRLEEALAHHAALSAEIGVFPSDELKEAGEIVASAFQVIVVPCGAPQTHHLRQTNQAVGVEVLVRRRSLIAATRSKVVVAQRGRLFEADVVCVAEGQHPLRRMARDGQPVLVRCRAVQGHVGHYCLVAILRSWREVDVLGGSVDELMLHEALVVVRSAPRGKEPVGLAEMTRSFCQRCYPAQTGGAFPT